MGFGFFGRVEGVTPKCYFECRKDSEQDLTIKAFVLNFLAGTDLPSNEGEGYLLLVNIGFLVLRDGFMS